MSAQTNYYSMKTAFELQLNTSLMEGMATIGRFDGRTPSLVCATSTQQLVLHTSESLESVEKRGGTGRDSVAPVRMLNFGKAPTALAVGRLRDTVKRKNTDALYFGSATSLLAYDVERNSEYFYKNVEDGVQAVVCGVVNTTRGSSGGIAPTPLTIVGGNCTINGFNESGEEVLWTVTGDQVTSLMLMPWDTPQDNNTKYITGSRSEAAMTPLSLVAASEDFELRVFDGEETIASITEVDTVRQLVYAGVPGQFAYLTAGGTVGVYNRTERLWRVKGRQRPVSAAFCDVDFDGVPELIVGWSGGRVEVRSMGGASNINNINNINTTGGEGGVMYRDRLSAPVTAVLAEDYRQNGQPLPIICAADGSVRGLELAGPSNSNSNSNFNYNSQSNSQVHRSREAFTLDALQRQRQALAAELASVEAQLRRQQKGETDVTLPQTGTVVKHKLLPNTKSRQLDIVLTVHHGYQDTIIQGCVLHSETAFPGKEYAFFTMEDPSPTLVCSLDIARGIEAHVIASIMVGATNAENYQIHELEFTIPKFSMYQPWENNQDLSFPEPKNYVTLQLPENFDFARLEIWLKTTFTLSNIPATNENFRILLIDIQDGSGLVIKGNIESRELQIFGETMEVCGDVVESLVTIDLNNVTAICHFPDELQKLQETLQRVEEFNSVRMKLSTSMADAAANVKPLLIRAEDSRLISDISNMRRFYAQLYDLNKELMAENLKRCNNYTELKLALKEVNAFIMKAGKLRIGQAKTRLISECREFVKAGDTRSLVNLIRTGQK